MLFILAYECLFSQKKDILYSLNIDKWVCNISLYNSGKYDVYLSKNLSNDVVYSLHLSQGSFSWKANLLTLCDKLHHFNQTFLYRDGKIASQKSFGFLSGRTLLADRSSYLDEKLSESVLVSYSKAKEERFNYVNVHKGKYSFWGGDYYSNNGFSLSLKKKQQYILSYKLDYDTILLSSGTWLQSGNMIVLSDVFLKSNFYLLVKADKSLISKYVLGDYKGIAFKVR